MSTSKPDVRSILALYKKLCRYSKSLKFTDKEFYLDRVRQEFAKNRKLTDVAELNFQYQIMKQNIPKSITERQAPYYSNSYYGFPAKLLFRSKSTKALLDFSRVPVLKEEEIEEQFIKGGGPGGSNVNKTVSCVSLKHKPTGIVVKCQFSRLLHQNRVLARESLIEKLDVHYNGEMSIPAQKLRLDTAKSVKSATKSRNLAELKKKYKEHVEKSKTDANDSHNNTDNNLQNSTSDSAESLNDPRNASQST